MKSIPSHHGLQPDLQSCPQMGLPELFLIWHFEKKFQSQLKFGNSGLNREKWATLSWSFQSIPVSINTGEFHEKNGTGITWRFLRLLSPSLSPLLSYLLGSYSVASFRLVLVSPQLQNYPSETNQGPFAQTSAAWRHWSILWPGKKLDSFPAH